MKITIVVHNGCIHEVYSASDLDVVVHDFDSMESNKEVGAAG